MVQNRPDSRGFVRHPHAKAEATWLSDRALRHGERVTQRGENLAQASFPEMEEAKAALHGLEGLESEPSQSRPRLRRPARPRRPPRPPRLRRLPPRPARAGRGRSRRPRLARRHAHRRRQEPLLPAPRARLRQAHHRGQPADRADGRPVAAALGRRPPGGDDRLGPPGGGRARRDGADPRRPGPDRLLLARALRPARLHERGRPARGRPARRRRGPLHLASGATTSAPTTCGCRGCSSGSAARR